MPHIRKRGNAMKRKSQSIPSIPRSRICFVQTRKPLSRKSHVRQENAKDRKTVSVPRREFLTWDLSSLSPRWEKRKKYIRGFSHGIPTEIRGISLFISILFSFPFTLYAASSVLFLYSQFVSPRVSFLYFLPRCDKSVAFQRWNEAREIVSSW